MGWRKRHSAKGGALLLFVGLCSCLVSGYSVLTHEQVVDLMWKDQIQPLLLKRFPEATEQDLQKAHAYAYGGCVLQDMGYYPFGNRFFSDLASKNSDSLSPALRENVLQFYSDPNAPIATRKNAKPWRQLQDELQQLKQRAAVSVEQPLVLNQ